MMPVLCRIQIYLCVHEKLIFVIIKYVYIYTYRACFVLGYGTFIDVLFVWKEGHSLVGYISKEI